MAGKNEAIIGEVKDNSKILVFGDNGIIYAVVAKLQNCKVITVNKDSEAIKRIKEKNYKNIEIIEKDINDFLNETELKEIETVIFYKMLSSIIDFQNRKIYLKVLFKILKNIISETGKIIITEDKDSSKAPEVELLEKIGKKEDFKLRVLADSPENYTIVLEKSLEDEGLTDYLNE